eukprot:3119082-Prymnesium_polylepis.1
MKTKQSQYHLGVAPTSRAKCKRCRSALVKGSVRLVATVFVARGHTARFSRCLACLDAPLAAAVKTACGGTERLIAAPGVDHAVSEGVRAELARLALVGKVGKVDKDTHQALAPEARRPRVACKATECSVTYMVSCTSAHCMAHSAQSDGMRERVCVARTCQSMVLTSTDVLAANRLHVGATVPSSKLCIPMRRPARRARRHTTGPLVDRNAVLARSARMEPKRTSEAIAMGALRSSNASVEARARRMALPIAMLKTAMLRNRGGGDRSGWRRRVSRWPMADDVARG